MILNSKILLSLTKSRLAISVVFSALAGYILAADDFDFLNVFLLLVGGYCIVGASNSFNQIIEKDEDSMMDRTKNRPLPQNQISTSRAFWISVFLTLLGLLCLYLINYKTVFFCSIICFSIYMCLYSFKTNNSFICFCWSNSRRDSFYARLGCRYESIWNRARNTIYDSILLAVSSFLVIGLDVR